MSSTSSGASSATICSDDMPSALRDLGPGRVAQKAEFGCEFFPNVVEAGTGRYFVDFFKPTVTVGARASSSSTWRSSNHDPQRTPIPHHPGPRG